MSVEKKHVVRIALVVLLVAEALWTLYGSVNLAARGQTMWSLGVGLWALALLGLAWAVDRTKRWALFFVLVYNTLVTIGSVIEMTRPTAGSATVSTLLVLASGLVSLGAAIYLLRSAKA